MQKINKILQIGALTISALGIISISNSKINHFDKLDNDLKLLNSSFADDENEDEDEDDKSYFLDNILSDSSINNTGNQDNISKLFKAPNGKVYSIIDDGTTVSIKKGDLSSAKKTFSNYNDAVAYLNQNAIPAPEIYKAANGKKYTIMFESGKVVIKKSDWSYAAKTFTSYAEAKTYLDKNAPKQIVTVKPVIKKTIAKTTNPVKKTRLLNTNITKKVIAKPVITVAKPVITVAKPVATKPIVSTPKVDTTTKAS